MTWVYNDFIFSRTNIMSTFRGDGEYLDSVVSKFKRVFLQHEYPNQIKSYKYQVYPNNIKGTSIVCFHGRPSIIQSMSETIQTPIMTYSPQEWVCEYWRI